MAASADLTGLGVAFLIGILEQSILVRILAAGTVFFGFLRLENDGRWHITPIRSTRILYTVQCDCRRTGIGIIRPFVRDIGFVLGIRVLLEHELVGRCVRARELENIMISAGILICFLHHLTPLPLAAKCCFPWEENIVAGGIELPAPLAGIGGSPTLRSLDHHFPPACYLTATLEALDPTTPSPSCLSQEGGAGLLRSPENC